MCIAAGMGKKRPVTRKGTSSNSMGKLGEDIVVVPRRVTWNSDCQLVFWKARSRERVGSC